MAGTVPGTECLNPDCPFRDKPIRKRYYCTICEGYLHPFTLAVANNVAPCSEDAGGDGVICCPACIGCNRKQSAQPPASTASKRAALPAAASALRRSPRKRPDKLPVRRSGANRGPKKGTKRTEYSKDYWYALCVKYDGFKEGLRPKQGDFLKSETSAYTDSMRVSFGSYLKAFRRGKLKPSSVKRVRESKYPEMDERLAAYIRNRQQSYLRDKVSVSWVYLHAKLRQWTEEMSKNDNKYKGFRASPGFISNVLTRHNLKLIRLHGADSVFPSEERLV